MQAPSESSIDVRAWLLWGAAASLPLITGRHPLILLELLIIVVVVRSVCLPAQGRLGWGWLLRVATIAVPIGVLFNMMTVHVGEQRLFTIPDRVPIIGGAVTWNAAAYGLLSGLSIVVLVAVGTTVAAAIEWTALMRLLPNRAGGLAVAGSVAWSFLPQLARSWREIRETQATRGHQWRGVRDFVPLMAPLLAGGLDRSVTTAEVLEARGFGVRAASNRVDRFEALTVIAALTLAVAGLYLLAVGEAMTSLGIMGLSVAMVIGLVWSGRGNVCPGATCYRRTAWTGRDTAITVGALIPLVTIATALQLAPESLRYDPYPDLTFPQTQPVIVLLLAALVIPAIVAPHSGNQVMKR